MIIVCHVLVKNEEEIIYSCFPRFSDDVGKRHLGEDFYKKWAVNGKIPQGPHFELELLSEVKGENLHIQKSVDGKDFVCFTESIPTTEAAEKFFEIWCMGTTYTIKTGKDFGTVYADAGGNEEKFFELMEKDYGIRAKIHTI